MIEFYNLAQLLYEEQSSSTGSDPLMFHLYIYAALLPLRRKDEQCPLDSSES